MPLGALVRLLASAVNVLTASLALVGNLFYVLVYTRWLKRSTPQNIVIGGAAGAVPPLVGFAAATGNLTLPALFLFAIVFFWTPPHFWALALLIKRDYAAAKVPMLPVVRGDRETARQVLLYTIVLVALTLVPVLTGTFGALYLAAAAILGGWFLHLAVDLVRHASRAAALFHYSLAYLALFVAMGSTRWWSCDGAARRLPPRADFPPVRPLIPSAKWPEERVCGWRFGLFILLFAASGDRLHLSRV